MKSGRESDQGGSRGCGERKGRVGLWVVWERMRRVEGVKCEEGEGVNCEEGEGVKGEEGEGVKGEGLVS